MAPLTQRRTPPTRILVAALAVTLVWLGCSTDDSDTTGPDPVSVLQEDLKPAINVQERNNERLFAIEGVVGTAVGRTEDGRPTIKVFTAEAGVQGVPRNLESFPVETVVTGIFVARNQSVDPTGRFPRPVPIGVSTGHPDITAGTIGARVKDDAGNVYALSNNHVYAVQNEAQIGDAALQPGPFDGGTDPADRIGKLFDFEPIEFNGGNNEMDAAIAISSVNELSAFTPGDGYGAPNAHLAAAFIGQVVKKYGRTTGLTEGEVAEVNVTVDVCYEGFIFCSKLARFVNQVSIAPGSFSDGGDSGSLIVTDDGTNRAVALLFAGSDTRTIASPIGPVLARFSVTMDDGSESEPPEPVTDVAVSQVSAPASATVGDVLSIDVTVENVGTEDVTADLLVTLNDDTDGALIGDQSIAGGLVAGASSTLSFTWDTDGASTGDHSLRATHDLLDDNAGNDEAMATVTIESGEPPVAGMHIGDLDVVTVNNDGRTWSTIIAVAVHDEAHNPVDAATVIGSWDPFFMGADECTTQADGDCLPFNANIPKREKSVSFTVMNVTHSTLTYVAAANHDEDGSSDGNSIVVQKP